MDFLPKRITHNVDVASIRKIRPNTHESKLKELRSDRIDDHGTVGSSVSANSKPLNVSARAVTSARQTWLIFAPTVVLSAVFVAAFQSGHLEGRQCAFAIGLTLTLYNIGTVFQKVFDRWLPSIGSLSQLVRAGLPLAILAMFFLWYPPASLSSFYDKLLKVLMAVVVIAIFSKIGGGWFADWLGRPGLTALRFACCFYLAILYVGSFVVKAPDLNISIESSLALIGMVAFLLHTWSDRTSLLPIQIASVTYTFALWDSQEDTRLLSYNLGVSLTLLFLLMFLVVAATGFWRIGRR